MTPKDQFRYSVLSAIHDEAVSISDAIDQAYKDKLKDYDTSKGTIRFQADKAMPAALVRKLIKSRIAENVG